jgi:hypothetical protein
MLAFSEGNDVYNQIRDNLKSEKWKWRPDNHED